MLIVTDSFKCVFAFARLPGGLIVSGFFCAGIFVGPLPAPEALVFNLVPDYQSHDNYQKKQDNIVGLNSCQSIKVAHCFCFFD